MSWPVVALGDLVDIRGGGTPSKKSPEYWGGEVPWASVKDFRGTELNETTDYITTLGVEKSATNIIPAGNIIVPTRMALGKVAINTVDMAINQDLKALIVRNEEILNKNYLKRFLEAKADFIEGHGKGATVKGITLDVLKKLEVPVPPIREQKRIATILDKADAIRRKRQQAIQLADEFLRAVFLDMFGDPVTNPKKWDTGPLATGMKSITSGWSANGESYPCGDDGLGVLKISSVTSGKFIHQENKFVHEDDIPEGKQLIFPKRGDLLFSRANTRSLVAATCVVLENQDNVFLPDKLWRVETDRNVILPEFLNFLIWDPGFKERLTSQATGTSGSMLNISKRKFEETPAIFPDLYLQEIFSDIFWRMQKVVGAFDLLKGNFDQFYSSLIQRAFAGHL